jgi:signal transduction histidine kinase
MSILRALVSPPEAEEYEQDKRIKFLHTTLWVTFTAMIIFGYLNIQADPPLLSRAMFLASGICLIALYLNAIGKFFLAAATLTSVVIFINFYNLYDGISLADPGIAAFPIIIIFSGFLFGKKSIYPIFVINLFSIFLLVYFERTGIIHPPETSSNETVIIISVLLLASAILLRAIMDNWEFTLGRARASEKQLREALEEVSKTRDELEVRVKERTADLQMANEEMEAFAYSVSHDLRAPLRAINGFTSILNDQYAEKMEDEERKYLDLILANSHRMNSLIEDMLLLSKIGRRDLIFEEIDLTVLVEELYANIIETGMEGKIDFSAMDCPIVRADKNLIGILLTNLLSNSIKFSKSQDLPKIEFGCLKEDGKDVCFLRDNGIGFDMKYADKIFNPFQRFHSQEEYEGTGIGLAIAKRIVQRHNGRIWVESELNRGTTIYFFLNK